MSATGCPKVNPQVRTSSTDDLIDFYKALDFAAGDAVGLEKQFEPNRL